MHLNTPQRTLTMEVEEQELEIRRAKWSPPKRSENERGYFKLHLDHVTQAKEGVDFDFLTKRPFTCKVPY